MPRTLATLATSIASAGLQLHTIGSVPGALVAERGSQYAYRLVCLSAVGGNAADFGLVIRPS